MDEDFAIMKIDMRNAFNLVSRQALLDECSAHSPELLPWGLVVLRSAPYSVASRGYHQLRNWCPAG